MTPHPPAPADPRAIVRALAEAGVEYVVIGGWAAVTYGVDRATFDLDIVVSASASNVRALATAMSGLGARRDLGAGMSEAFSLDAPGVLLAGPLRLLTDEGPVDILTQVPGASFKQLRSDARLAAFGDGTEFVIASKPALENLKAAMVDQDDPVRGGRDTADLEELRRLPDPGLPPA